MTVTILVGDVREKLSALADNSIHCCVTSPPYWGLRDYGVEGQIGLEASPAEFIAALVAVFEEVRRVLRPDGTCWINMGDSYATGAGKVGNHPGGGPQGAAWRGARGGHEGKHAYSVGARGTGALAQPNRMPQAGFKPKDMVMMPHRLAIALQDAGWWVRQDIVWNKPNPMPESVRDRCTKAHEYIFLLTKSERYYYDADAIAESCVWEGIDGTTNGVSFGHGTDAEHRGRGRIHLPGNKTHKGVTAYEGGAAAHRTKAGLVAYAERQRGKAGANAFRGQGSNRNSENGHANREGRDLKEVGTEPTRNKRSVWTIATKPFSEAHFATFPPELPETCIKAGCPIGGVVLDPFFGAGTTGLVADRLQRDCIGIELNPTYAEMARKRIQGDASLLTEVRVAA